MSKPTNTIHSDWIRHGEPEYDEVVRILGTQCMWVADERVRQVNNRWLKANMFIKDDAGEHLIIGDSLPTRSQRIRIPKGSALSGRTFR